MDKKRPSLPSTHDVRMRGFAQRTPVAAALAWVDEAAQRLDAEVVSLNHAAGRVLTDPYISKVDVPGFDRAMMDGYIVHAADCAGATAYNRLPLQVIGEALPGKACEKTIGRGQAVRVMTGAPLPAGADAVLPVEFTEIEDEQVFAIRDVPSGKHIGRRGEDICTGNVVLPAGRRLRPQDVGVLSSIGASQIQVVRRPTVRILVTGDEILPPGSTPSGFQIVDANSPMLNALVARDGGVVTQCCSVADHPQAILDAMQEDADVVLVSGGSSVGQEDHAPVLLATHGDLAIHGVAMRPSSPAGMGRLGTRLVFLQPGNPVSCLCAYDFFAGRAIRQLGGLAAEWPYRQARLPLARKIVSPIGRTDYARVAIQGDLVEPLAISGASLLTSTTRADGFVIIDVDHEGLPSGAEVDVYLYD